MRAVIITGAQARDHWTYFLTIYNVLHTFTDSPAGDGIDPNTVSILTPCFLDRQDMEAGAGNASQLYWSSGGWFIGRAAIGPVEDDMDSGEGEGDGGEGNEDGEGDSPTTEDDDGSGSGDREKVRKRDTDSGAPSITSFDVLDNIVDHYMDKSRYPNLQEMVFAGHSAAGQFFQRYAALRKYTNNDENIHYLIANPASYLWLTTDRPDPNENCTDIDKYKYGLQGGLGVYAEEDVATLGRTGVVKRYRERNIHYAYGTADNAVGDSSCQAMTQGSSHLDRGLNFIMLLESMSEGMPATHTVDWLKGVGHIQEDMFGSNASMIRLFKNASISSTGERPAATSVYVTTASDNDPPYPLAQNNVNGSVSSIHLGGFLWVISTLSFMFGILTLW